MMVAKLNWAAALLLLLAALSTATFIQQECLASRSVRVPWLWSQVEAQGWLDQEALTSPSPILQFNITVLGENGEEHHIIHVMANSTTMTEGQDGSPEYEMTREPETSPGWIRITVTIFNNVTIEKTGVDEEGEGELLLSYPLQYPVADVTVSGSNVTVNCPSGRLIWRIRGHGISKYIPLSPSPGLSHLSFYAQRPVLPSLRLPGGRTFTLGLFYGQPSTLASIITSTDSSTATATTQPLPAFTEHHFLIDCTHDDGEWGVQCDIMMNSEVLETAYFPSRPLYLQVGGSEGVDAPFLLFQYTSDPPASPLPRLTTPPVTTTPPSAPTLPPPSPGPDYEGPLSRSVEKSAGWSGWWVFVALVLAILLVFIIIMCVISHYHRPKIEKYFGVIPGLKMMMEGGEEEEEEEEEVEQGERRPLFNRSISLINTHDPKAAAPLRLWNAVASGTESEVKQVVDTLGPDPTLVMGGRDTSPYQEAHNRGHVNVLRVLEAFMHRRPDVAPNDMVLGVLQAHSKKVDEVFAAAQGGQYRHSGGVDVLLRAFSLPGTLQDSQGRSLLHYAGSMALADSGPLWLADDIRSLVETHGVYVNAVDFVGRTALHALAEKASMSEQHTCWDGRTLSVREAWLALANLLLTLGVNPTLLDHTGKLPSHLAADADNEHLADLLIKAEGKSSPAGHDDPLERCRQLVEASGRGDVGAMTELLTAGAGTVLPLGSRRDPLLAAVQNGHRDAMFLLLAAGAPLCAHGLLGNTPFQAAHTTLGLPALFPAVIRKVFCDQLEWEADALDGDDQVVVLREGLRHLRTIAELSGHRLGEELSTWLDRRPAPATSDYMDMMALAASNGLTLTCQLLGVAGVPLNPLPHQPHPLAHALEASRHDTAYSLCRDLKMNPYSLPNTTSEVPAQLLNHLVLSELQKFEIKLSKKEVESGAAQDLLEYARGRRTSHNRKQLTTFLYLLAELDLITILHQVREAQDDLDINAAVHKASGATMLHVAAAYGKIGMVEYLLGHGADHTRYTRAGLAPVHLAALRGHQACMKYIMAYTKAELGCSTGLTPSLMFEHFSANVKSRHLDILTVPEANNVTATKGDHAKARLILAGRCSKLGIKSSSTLWNVLCEEERKMEELIAPEMESLIQTDVQRLCDQIAQIDGRFRGKVVFCSPLEEKTQLLLPENFDFCLEVQTYSGLQDGCVNVKEIGENGQPGEHTVEISSTKDSDLFSNSNFKTSFSKAAHEALGTVKFKSLALVPPFLAHTTTGVCIHAAYRSKKRIILVRVSVSPVIKVPRPQWLSIKLPKRFRNQGGSCDSHEHLVNVLEGTWSYQFNPTLRCVFGRASETERRVAQACLYLRKLLEICWWLPKQEERKKGRALQTYPVGVTLPEMSTLLTHFLEEVVLEQGEDGSGWGQNQFLERVVGVMKRLSMCSLSQSPPPVLIPKQWEARMSNATEATVQFLLDLLQNSMENGQTVSV